MAKFAATEFVHLLEEKEASWDEDAKKWMTSIFEELNKHCKKSLAQKELGEKEVGATAVIAFIRKQMLYVANAGDSRAVLAQRGDGEELRAVRLSKDHKPLSNEERQRIREKGGELISMMAHDPFP